MKGKKMALKLGCKAFRKYFNFFLTIGFIYKRTILVAIDTNFYNLFLLIFSHVPKTTV